VKTTLHIDDANVRRGLAAARREINRGVKDGLRQGAEQIGLPAAKRLAPGHRIREALRAGATTRTAYIEASLRKAPEAGLLEFGGTVRTVLLPKNAEAISTPYGPRAAVRGPRRYRARRYMQRAVKETLPAVEQVAGREIMKVYERAGLEVER
jgi:hypothetical protein